MFLILKWVHILAIISWMAGVLYYYRLLIYHRENLQDTSRCELLSLMEFRLYRYITMPAMGVAVLAGAGLVAFMPALLLAPWLYIKVLCVFLLIHATVYGKKISQKLQNEKNHDLLPTSKTLRFLNEVPTVLMMIIIGMVVFRPFG